VNPHRQVRPSHVVVWATVVSIDAAHYEGKDEIFLTRVMFSPELADRPVFL
jgi:hypothetical protein